MTPGAVVAIAMTLSELCTNTTKFGAVSLPTGRVDVGWTLGPDTQRAHLTWTERNGPAVHAPEKQRPANKRERRGKIIRHHVFSTQGLAVFGAAVAVIPNSLH
jgi:two-component sensor histidine kinase